MSEAFVKSSWRRIRQWYKSNVHELPYPEYLTWASPATKEEIAEFERVTKLSLPSDVRASFLIHNGDNHAGVFDGYYLMPLEEISLVIKGAKDHIHSLVDSDANPRGPIKQRWWNLQWVPILSNTGDLRVIDLDPAQGGAVGQFIDWDHETGPSHVIATSFGEYLKHFADDLEAGRYQFDEDEGSIKSIDK